MIFYSPNEDESPDFKLKQKYLFDAAERNCYFGLVSKSFDSVNAANEFIAWKRPVYSKPKFRFEERTTVETMVVHGSDSSSDDSDSKHGQSEQGPNASRESQDEESNVGANQHVDGHVEAVHLQAVNE